jgi:hypothetical protein
MWSEVVGAALTMEIAEQATNVNATMIKNA